MNIEKRVNQLVRKYKTRNPLEIAERMGCIIIRQPLADVRGFYYYFQRNHIICIDDNLPENVAKFVTAHELGHIVLHKGANAIFMDSKTLFNRNKLENEANKFAIDLLISDDEMKDYQGFTIYQIADTFGYDANLIELRLQDYVNKLSI